MSSGRRSAYSQPSSEKLDPTITAYTLMTSEQVETELRAHGIDPQPTIDAIRSFVEGKLLNSSRAVHRRK